MYSSADYQTGSDYKDTFNVKETSYEHDIEAQIREGTRIGFIRKVYGILSVQLAITFGISCLGMVESVKKILIIESPRSLTLTSIGLGLLITCCILFFFTLIPLACCMKVGRRVPINYILLLLFTLSQSYLVLLCCCRYEQHIVLTAMGLTAAVTISLTIYALTTKEDFTWLGGLLFSTITILIIGGILCGVWGFSGGRGYHVLYCCCGILVYSIYIIFDTQLIAGKYGTVFEIDDYIFAALTIYIDIIQLFLFILSLLGGGKK